MKLSSDDKAQIKRWLDERWKEPVCQICRSNTWQILETVHELREFHGGTLIAGTGILVPVVPVTCMNCGNTVFINAVVAKLKLNPGGE